MERKFCAAFLLGIWCYYFPVGAQDIKMSDRAVFNCQGDIVFLSDLQQLLVDVRNIRCIHPQSFLLEAAELGPTRVPQLPDLTEMNLEQNIELVGKLVKLYNLRAQVMKTEQRPAVSEKQQDIYRKKYYSGHCGETNSWRQSTVQLFWLEEYLQERFKDGDLTPAEKNAWRIKSLNISTIELEKKIAKKEREMRVNSAQNYLNTLNEQLTIQKYY